MHLRMGLTLLALLALSTTACTTEPRGAVKPKKHLHEKLTADDQTRGTNSDIEVTRKIRSRLSHDAALSFSAQNITIVTFQMSVTLKGEVRDQKEKDRILEHARKFTGPRSINNQMIYTE